MDEQTTTAQRSRALLEHQFAGDLFELLPGPDEVKDQPRRQCLRLQVGQRLDRFRLQFGCRPDPFLPPLNNLVGFCLPNLRRLPLVEGFRTLAPAPLFNDLLPGPRGRCRLALSCFFSLIVVDGQHASPRPQRPEGVESREPVARLSWLAVPVQRQAASQVRKSIRRFRGKSRTCPLCLPKK
jgi:hypothetical protein